MLELLAQLVTPPLQNSPVRLPSPGAEERRPAPGETAPEIPLEVPPEQPPPGEPSPPTAPESGSPIRPYRSRGSIPEVRGLWLYSKAELARILAACGAIAEEGPRLEACAAALTARLVADGYVSSRAYPDRTRTPPALFVVEGRLAEVLVSGEDPWLVRRTRRLVRSLQGSVLHLPTLERQLQLLRRQRGIAAVRGNLTRLGSDPANASFTINVEAQAPAWQGEFSLRNDGTNETGDARIVGNLLKADLALRGDTLLLYGEVNGTDDPEFGSVISSISYTVPLADTVFLTGAYGFSRRNLIELPSPADQLSINQYQYFGQLEWVFRESLEQRWSLFAGLSHNHSTTFLQGRRLDPAFVPESVSEPRSGYLQVGLSGSGLSGNLAWSGTASVLQGLGAFTPERQRRELAFVGIEPGRAGAFNAFLTGSWNFAPAWQLTARAGGQIAFHPLTSPMRFTLGSDVGLRGLPGQFVSGDHGWLTAGELSWTFWQKRGHALQLVPFLGVGGVSTTLPEVAFSDAVGAGGVLVRWLAGSPWVMELGWVDQFNTNDNLGEWQDWALGQGLYARIQYRF